MLPPTQDSTTFPFFAVTFAALFFLAPLPTFIFEGLVPLANMFLMAFVAATVAASQGAGGPVGWIVLLLIAHVVVYCAVLAAAALLARIGLRRLPRRFAFAIVTGLLAVALAFAILTEPYVTPFGPQPRANLFGALS